MKSRDAWLKCVLQQGENKLLISTARTIVLLYSGFDATAVKNKDLCVAAPSSSRTLYTLLYFTSPQARPWGPLSIAVSSTTHTFVLSLISRSLVSAMAEKER